MFNLSKVMGKLSLYLIAGLMVFPGLLIQCEDPNSNNGGDDFTPITYSGRIIFSEHEQSQVKVLNLEDATEVGAFTVESEAARVHPTASGQYATILQIENNYVHFVDSGASSGSFNPPSLMATALDAGTNGLINPVHFTYIGDWHSIFYDGAHDPTETPAKVISFQESDFTGSTFAYREWTSAEHHHGVALPWDNLLISTRKAADQMEEGGLPNEVEILQYDTTAGTYSSLQDFPGCNAIHGEEHAGEYIGFGCQNGVLILEHQDGNTTEPFTHQLIEYDAADAGHRVFLMYSHPNKNFFIGDFNAGNERAFISVNLSSSAASLGTKVELNHAWCRVGGFEPSQGNMFVGITDEGSVEILDANDLSMKLGEIEQVVMAHMDDEHGHDHGDEHGHDHGDEHGHEHGSGGCDAVAESQIALGNMTAYITDPKNGEIVEVDLQNLRVNRRLKAGAEPANLAVFGQ